MIEKGFFCLSQVSDMVIMSNWCSLSILSNSLKAGVIDWVFRCAIEKCLRWLLRRLTVSGLSCSSSCGTSVSKISRTRKKGRTDSRQLWQVQVAGTRGDSTLIALLLQHLRCWSPLQVLHSTLLLFTFTVLLQDVHFAAGPGFVSISPDSSS